MPTESNTIELEHSVEIYVPTQCRCGNPLPEDIRSEILEEVKASMYGWFGGVSKKDGIRVEEIEGSWPLKSGEMANEQVDVVYSNASPDSLKEHFEELPALAASIANRLTQESVAFRVDKKMTLMPGQDTKPHRCAGGASPGSLPVARQPDEKERMRALQASLQRISSVRDARDLFCNVLHYEFEDEQLATVKWPDKLKECLAPSTSPRIIADQNGFKILYLQLAEDYLRKGSERQLVLRIIKDDPTLRGLVVVSDIDQKEWHLVNAKFEKEEGKQERLRLRRMRVGPDQSVRTAVERLSMVDIDTAGEKTTAAELQDLHDRAFDVESVSKEFFNEISNWYFWALSEVEFPTDTLSGDDDEKHRATSLIRFLTRVIFCWFLKEKDLVPANLFRQKDLTDILTDLDPDSCTYHQGILQNLFFATLNQRMGKDSKGLPYRTFAKDEGFLKNKSTYGVDTLYRYEEHFRDPDKALSHFAEVPFLNGGLFECLDRTNEDTGKKLYVDGFSRNKKKRPHVPNLLFFAGEQTVDLSAAYGDTKRRNAKVRGLLNILHAYNFTVEENTPIDEEIALDPELLGKVFENLLASYNEETKTTARKKTGSFYTPRPVVEYMVDESLKVHLSGTLTTLGQKEEEAREQLNLLLGYTDEELSFSEREIDALLEAIHTCKILDPACGSGAFPIGVLQKLVHVVHKLDPDNDKFEAIQIREAQKIEDRNERRKQIEQIGRDFAENDVDYGRKLYLIENCLYGVDIQPIAIQISKLRFFISLICDQKTNRDKKKNHGIRALPNLETKFVAANTLMALPEMDQVALVDPRVSTIEAEIGSLYHRHFSIQRRDQKLAIQIKLRDLRKELGRVLAESLGSSQKAQHLADWDPFDSQESSDFFDPHWMFGPSLAVGFDIVIGNPPYIGEKGNKDIFSTIKRGGLGGFYKGKVDVFYFFFHSALSISRDGGCIAFITTNYFPTADGAVKLRSDLKKRSTIHKMRNLGDIKVFESALGQHNMISVLIKGLKEGAAAKNCITKRKGFVSPAILRDILEGSDSETDYFEVPQEDLWDGEKNYLRIQGVKGSGGDGMHSILRKLSESKFKLGDVCTVNIGMRTGADKVSQKHIDTYKLNLTKGSGIYVITQRECDKLNLNQSEKAMLLPFFKNSDIRKYSCDTNNDLWLVDLTYPRFNNPDWSKIPHFRDHIWKFEKILKGRKSNDNGLLSVIQNGYWWCYTLRQLDFSQPKIISPQRSLTNSFALSTTPWVASMDVYYITQKNPTLPLKYVLGLLNSSLYYFWLYHRGKRKGDSLELYQRPLSEVPITLGSTETQSAIVERVDRILKEKERDKNSCTEPLEREIDQLVYALYRLNDAEIQVVEDLRPPT